MKKMFNLMMLVFAISVFSSCSKDDDKDDEKGGSILKIFGKEYRLTDADGFRYYQEEGEFHGELGNDSEKDMIVLGFTAYRLHPQGDKQVEINKEYKAKDLIITLSLNVIDYEIHDLENPTFYMNEETKVTVLENNIEEKKMKVQFKNIKWDCIDLVNGEIVETIENSELVIEFNYEVKP